MDASRLVPSWMRLVHRWYAEMTGDFWARCILCLREYGGHEWRAAPGAIPDPIRGVGHVLTICPVCTRAGLSAYQPTLFSSALLDHIAGVGPSAGAGERHGGWLWRRKLAWWGR